MFGFIKKRLGLLEKNKGTGMFDFIKEQLDLLEKDKSIDTRPKALHALRAVLCLEDFGEFIISLPAPGYPKLSSLLPRMASVEVQKSWTGASGTHLLGQTLSFVRSVSYNYAKYNEKSLSNAAILDYGCGYGRIARLMYSFTAEENVFGCDPWARSIDICKEDGLGTNFVQSEYLPTELPFGSRKFDFVYAFSVFTHLSERATRSALGAIRKSIQRDGLLVITVRPLEFWEFAKDEIGGLSSNPQRPNILTAAELRDIHNKKGFAFQPHDRTAIDGDITYGDTSVSFEWLENNCPDWKIVGIDRSMSDRYQIYVFLKPK